MSYLVVGIILIVLLVGVTLLQWALRRWQASRERALPHVSDWRRWRWPTRSARAATTSITTAR